MKLTILGTGNAMVTECYNTCFSISDGKEHFLVDAGGGNTILKQLKDAGIDWREIKHIFVTHKHVDHILGVMWLVRIICQNMSMNNYEGDAYIYSHKEVITIIRQMAGALLWEKHAAYLDKRLHLVEIEDGECKEILGKKVYFFDIQSDKDIQFGFTMFLNKKEKLSCCGDEPFNEANKSWVQGSKWLLHEAFCLQKDAQKCKVYEKHHCTVKDACETAEKLEIENLLLYHTEDENLAERKKLYTQEGKKYFSGNLFVPDDLDVLTID